MKGHDGTGEKKGYCGRKLYPSQPRVKRTCQQSLRSFGVELRRDVGEAGAVGDDQTARQRQRVVVRRQVSAATVRQRRNVRKQPTVQLRL